MDDGRSHRRRFYLRHRFRRHRPLGGLILADWLEMKEEKVVRLKWENIV